MMQMNVELPAVAVGSDRHPVHPSSPPETRPLPVIGLLCSYFYCGGKPARHLVRTPGGIKSNFAPATKIVCERMKRHTRLHRTDRILFR